MCCNIKTLFNFEPPAIDEEVRDASLQFDRDREVEAEKARMRARKRFGASA